MAFEPRNLIKVTTPEGPLFEFNASDRLPSQLFLYGSNSDNIATVSAAAYFDITGPQSPKRALLEEQLRVNDWIMASCSDGNVMLRVTAATPAARVAVYSEVLDGSIGTNDLANLAVTNAKIGPDAVDGAKIADDAISEEHLDAGIVYDSRAVFTGQVTTVGGGAAEGFAIAGVLATDYAFVQIVDNGTANVTALQAVCTANTLTVTFSGDPGNDAVFNYIIMRDVS